MTVLSSKQPILTIPVTLGKFFFGQIYKFLRGVFLRKMAKIIHF